MRQPVSLHRVRFEMETPLCDEAGEEDKVAFLHYRVQVSALEPDPQSDDDEYEPRLVATADAFVVRRYAVADYVIAADAQEHSEFLDLVCLDLLEGDTGCPTDEVADALGEAADGVIVLDNLEVLSPEDDSPALRGRIARRALDVLGALASFPLLVISPDCGDFQLWLRAVGAMSVKGYTIASGAFVLPDFPLAVARPSRDEE